MSHDFLVTTWEGGGNVPPTLGAISRLIARGHRVRVLADDALRQDIVAVGASFVPWRRAPNRPDRSAASDTLRDWEAEGEGAGLIRLLERVSIGPAAAYAADTIDELQRRPADVLVNCDILFGPMIAAEATGTKLALFSPNISFVLPIAGIPPVGPGMMPPSTAAEHAMAEAVHGWLLQVMAAQLPALNDARAACGLDALPEVFAQPARADRLLLATSRAFDFPATALPPEVRYVGPLLDQPRWTGQWISPWGADDTRPLVLIAFSSTFQNQAGAMQAVFAAAADLPVRVLATRGPALAGVTLDLPDNGRVVDAAPHDAVMQEAAVVVTHCGHGTIMRALAHARPLLCLPMGRDQNDNAARVVARGAGLRLAPDAAPAAIRSALQPLLRDPAFTEASARLGQSIAASEPASALVDELEALAAQSHATSAASFSR